MPPITAASAAFVRLLTGGPPGVVLERGVLRFTGRSAIPAGAIDRIEPRPSWFWTRLTVREAGSAVHAIGGLARGDAERVAAAVREETARAAGEVAGELRQLSERLTSFLSGDRYRRHSAGAELQADIATVVPRCSGALLRSHLAPDGAAALARIRPVASPAAFERAREEANDRSSPPAYPPSPGRPQAYSPTRRPPSRPPPSPPTRTSRSCLPARARARPPSSQARSPTSSATRASRPARSSCSPSTARPRAKSASASPMTSPAPTSPPSTPSACALSPMSRARPRSRSWPRTRRS